MGKATAPQATLRTERSESPYWRNELAAAHTLTLTAGTFDGTNNVATLNAPGEALAVFVDGDGNGTILENTGAVALS